MSKLFKKVILFFNVFIVSTFVLLGCSKNDEIQSMVKS